MTPRPAGGSSPAHRGRDPRHFVLLNLGNGTFAPAVNHATGVGSFSVAADLDGDGEPDLAVTNQTSGNVSVLLSGCLP